MQLEQTICSIFDEDLTYYFARVLLILISCLQISLLSSQSNVSNDATEADIELKSYQYISDKRTNYLGIQVSKRITKVMVEVTRLNFGWNIMGRSIMFRWAVAR